MVRDELKALEKHAGWGRGERLAAERKRILARRNEEHGAHPAHGRLKEGLELSCVRARAR